MSNIPMRRTDLRILTLLPIAGLIVLVAARGQLGLEADPLRLCGLILGASLALAVVARHPAAFVAPVLFLPGINQLSGVSALSGLGPLMYLTERQVLCSLLVCGLLIRWLCTGSLTSADHAAPLQERDGAESAASRARQPRDGRRAVIAFFLFVVIVSISYTYSLAPDYGQQKLLGFLTLGCGLFVVPPLLFRSKRDFRDFMLGTALFGLVVAVSSLQFSATGAMAAGDNPSHIGKGQAIGLAMLMLLYAPVEDRRFRAVILLLCIPFLAIGMVSAETRGPLFSLLFVLLLAYFVPSMRSTLISRRQMLFSAIALVAALILLSTFWFYGTSAFSLRYKSAEIINLVDGNGEAQGTAVERLQFYHAAFESWLERPIFGWGLGSWSMIYWHQDIRQYPHNLFFEVLVEQGLAGVAALLIFLLAVFRQLRANRREIAALVPCLLPCLVYLLSIAMFSGDLDNDRFIWFWCGLSLNACVLARNAVKGVSRSREELRGSGCIQFSAAPNQ